MPRAPRRAALWRLLLAWVVASGACGTQVADTPIVPGTRYHPAVDETQQPLRFSEVTDALFASPDNLVVLDRVASTLTLIRRGTRVGSLRLPDSTTGALLLSPVRGDSVAVWDAFSGTVSYVDGSLGAIGRVKDDLPVLHSVVGVFGEGAPVLAPVYPMGASAASTYAPESTPLAVWTDSLRPLGASIPQWPSARIRVGEHSAVASPVWARRGRAQVRGDAVWIGDGNEPVLVRVDVRGARRNLTVSLSRPEGDRSEEIARRLALLPPELRDSVRTLFGLWAAELPPPYFTSFRIDRCDRIWFKVIDRTGSEGAVWVVFGPRSKLLARISMPEASRFLDATEHVAVFSAADSSGSEVIQWLPLQSTRPARRKETAPG